MDNTLYDALFSYAAQYRIPLFLADAQQELQDQQHMADHALDALRALDGPVSALADRVEEGLQSAAQLNGRGCFLAGLAMGLELGRLAR